MRIEDHGAGVGGEERIRDSHLSDHTVYADLNFKAVVQFLLGVGVIVVLSYIAVWGIFEFFEAQHAKNNPPLSPTAQVEWVPPAIDVQAAPHLDRALIEKEDRAEIDREVGSGERISIEDAIEKTLNQGLPFRGDKATQGSEENDQSDDTQEKQ